MATQQEKTIVDVIHAALDRIPVPVAITILSGIYAEWCTENGIAQNDAVQFVQARFTEYSELSKSSEEN
jgi:hypothetical protein